MDSRDWIIVTSVVGISVCIGVAACRWITSNRKPRPSSGNISTFPPSRSIQDIRAAEERADALMEYNKQRDMQGDEQDEINILLGEQQEAFAQQNQQTRVMLASLPISTDRRPLLNGRNGSSGSLPSAAVLLSNLEELLCTYPKVNEGDSAYSIRRITAERNEHREKVLDAAALVFHQTRGELEAHIQSNIEARRRFTSAAVTARRF